MKKTICELFAGVGGFRLGFDRLDSGWETVWFSQWEPSFTKQWAHDCYISHYGDSPDLNGEYHTNEDIATVDKYAIPDHSLLVGGFPCQDYSVAKSLSISKGIEGKKGVLWWQIRDVLVAKEPPFCILENVDRLISSPAWQRGRDFGIILACFYELGYSVEWRVINAAQYGAAQKRRRTFIFAYKDACEYGKRIGNAEPIDIIERDGFMVRAFPIESSSNVLETSITTDILDVSDNFSFRFQNAGYMHSGNIFTTKVTAREESPIPLREILQSNVDESYYLSPEKIKQFKYLKGKKSIPRVSKTGYEYTFSEGEMSFPDTLDEPGRTLLTGEGAVSRTTHVVEDPETGRLRTLTPLETERLQGFDDNWTGADSNKRARYFCMGNALVVPMVTRMGSVLDEIIENEKSNTNLNPMNVSNDPFLYYYQYAAVEKMSNGCILNGGVGSGKSRTGLYYYFKEQGGSINPDYIPMKNPRDLYIITTAMKRDSLEFEGELANYLMSTNPELNYYDNNIIIDSWNNIKKYSNVYGAFFIFDEDRVTGKGVWVKSFLKIAKKNHWIILSATPGDTWEQYIPVFVANGFYKNKTEFSNEHIVYSRFTKYPKIDRYINTGRLLRYRNQILIDMDFSRHTIPHNEDIYVKYDSIKYKEAIRTRWDPFKNEPIQQASGLCYVLRRIVNEDESRQVALLELLENHPKTIIFYSFNYELELLEKLATNAGFKVAQWNGHNHQPIPEGNKWVYLVQYSAGCEGWNCIKTDTIIFYSQHYSYKVVTQAAGRIDRLNTPYTDLYYYHLKSRSGIDLAISKALAEKKQFNERKWTRW